MLKKYIESRIDKTLLCNVSPNTTKFELQQHMGAHTSVSYTCGFCGLTFDIKSALYTYTVGQLRVHTATCICILIRPSPQNFYLEKHQRSHDVVGQKCLNCQREVKVQNIEEDLLVTACKVLNKNRFKCQICMASFMQASHCPDVEPGWTHDV